MPPPGPVSPTRHAPPVAQVAAVELDKTEFLERVVSGLDESEREPPQALSAIAATASSANFLDRVLIDLILRIYNSFRRELLHPSLLHTGITENRQAEQQNVRTTTLPRDTTHLSNTAPQDSTSKSV